MGFSSFKNDTDRKPQISPALPGEIYKCQNRYADAPDVQGGWLTLSSPYLASRAWTNGEIGCVVLA